MDDKRLGDYILSNPTIKLKKGEQYQLTDIDSITIGRKYPVSKGLIVYDGQSGSKFSKGDTIMARITPCLENGKLAMYNGEEDSIGSTELFVFRGKEGISTNEFVYYFFKQNWIRNYAANSMTGASGRQRADIKFIQKAKVQFPPLPVQQKIASILSTYDSQIENNQKRIKLLEQMAENLYKEWFVRFRFPGYETAEFDGGIPKGWRVENLGKVCKIVTGKKDANQANNEGVYPFFTCSRETNLTTDEYFLDTDAVLISGNGSYTGFVKKYSGKFDLYQRTYALYSFTDVSWLYVYWVLKTDFEKRYMGGTKGSAIPYITMPDLTRYKFFIPSKELLIQATKIFLDIHRECNMLLSNISLLSSQRDMLLPRLMSGQLSI